MNIIVSPSPFYRSATWAALIAIKDFREGFNAVIREAGVEFDSEANELVFHLIFCVCRLLRHLHTFFFQTPLMDGVGLVR
jgi:hypothetical protein